MIQLTVKYLYVIIKMLTVFKSGINLPVWKKRTFQENKLAVFGRQEMSGEQLTVFGRKEVSGEPSDCVSKTRDVRRTNWLCLDENICHKNQLAVFGRQDMSAELTGTI